MVSGLKKNSTPLMKHNRLSSTLFILLVVILSGQFLLGPAMVSGQPPLESTLEYADQLDDQNDGITVALFVMAHPPINPPGYLMLPDLLAGSLSRHEIHATGPPSRHS